MLGSDYGKNILQFLQSGIRLESTSFLPQWGSFLAQTNMLLKHIASDDEDVQRHVAFVERWLEWNADEEIWARAMDAWKNSMNDDDPHLPFLSEEMQADLIERSSSLPKE